MSNVGSHAQAHLAKLGEWLLLAHSTSTQMTRSPSTSSFMQNGCSSSTCRICIRITLMCPSSARGHSSNYFPQPTCLNFTPVLTTFSVFSDISLRCELYNRSTLPHVRSMVAEDPQDLERLAALHDFEGFLRST